MKRFYGSFYGRPSGLARVKKLYHDEWPVGVIDDIYRYGIREPGHFYRYRTISCVIEALTGYAVVDRRYSLIPNWLETDERCELLDGGVIRPAYIGFHGPYWYLRDILAYALQHRPVCVVCGKRAAMGEEWNKGDDFCRWGEVRGCWIEVGEYNRREVEAFRAWHMEARCATCSRACHDRAVDELWRKINTLRGQRQWLEVNKRKLRDVKKAARDARASRSPSEASTRPETFGT